MPDTVLPGLPDGVIACLTCGSGLSMSESPVCACCGSVWSRSEFGYLDFLAIEGAPYASTTADYVERMQSSGQRLADDFLAPWLRTGDFSRVLDAGCGAGVAVRALQDAGFDAWGLDLPDVGWAWATARADRNRFVHADVRRLPFGSGSFDAVISVGVLEHVGTVDGHSQLAPDYVQARERYVSELLRVLRPGGRLLLAAPNKWFPVDLQHGPDGDSSRFRWRSRVFERTHANIHTPIGPYFLPSPLEAKAYLRAAGGVHVRPLGLRAFLGLSLLETRPRLKKLVTAYLNGLPGALRLTPFNPYVLLECQKA